VRADVVQAQRVRIADQHAEDAAPAREVADRPVRGLVDARGEEPLELGALLVEHADGRVARARELARHLEQAVRIASVSSSAISDRPTSRSARRRSGSMAGDDTAGR